MHSMLHALLALCVASAASFRPGPTLSTAHRTAAAPRTTAARMTDDRSKEEAEAALERMQQRMADYNKEKKPLTIDPKIYTVAYSAIVVVSLKDLSENPVIGNWIEDGASLDAVPWLSFSGGAILITYALFQLAFQFGTGSATPFRLAVMKLGATEPAFSSPLNEEKRDGDYLCSSCGAKLFDSSSKYDSGSGWPAFWRTYDGSVSYEKEVLGGRMEVRCGACRGHLGHVFSDGPSIRPEDPAPPATDPGGEDAAFELNDKTVHPRFCINGCALEFAPAGEGAAEQVS